MIEFMRGIRMPVSTTRRPASWRTVSKAAVNLQSRSRIMNFALLPVSSRSMARFRASCVAHAAVGVCGGDLNAEGGEFPVEPPVAPRAVLAGEAQDQGADGAYDALASASPRRAGRGMALVQQFAGPAQDSVRTHQQVELPQLLGGEVVQERGQQRAVVRRERGLAHLALQDRQLVRSARISTSLSQSLIGSMRMSANVFVKAR